MRRPDKLIQIERTLIEGEIKKDEIELLKMAVRSHMGQWTENRDERPFTPIDRVVHLADYISSRPFIDIPTISGSL